MRTRSVYPLQSPSSKTGSPAFPVLAPGCFSANPALFHIKNTVTLMGFVGADPNRRQTKDNNSFTVLSLATKASWKNKETSAWESRTEWHRGLVFGSLADYAATLKRGAHVLLQGELRSREYEKPVEGKKKTTIKQRIWEIHVMSILKLDRAERMDETAAEREQVEDPEVAP